MSKNSTDSALPAKSDNQASKLLPLPSEQYSLPESVLEKTESLSPRSHSKKPLQGSDAGIGQIYTPTATHKKLPSENYLPMSQKKPKGKLDPPAAADKDFGNIVLLIVLYWLQGVPLGLSSGSIPFLLKEKMSFAQIGIFSLAAYPYSLKLFWSPIVDSCYKKRFGRRKSWIVPVQFLTGLILFILGTRIDSLMQNPSSNITTISISFFVLVLLSATQDIAVDGWALTLLSKERLAYASTCQTIGLNSGYFMSFTVFLALNTPDFPNKYFRSIPQDYGLLQLGTYMKSWAVLYILITLYLIFFVHEKRTHETMSISSTYKTIYQIFKLPDMIKFIFVLLFTKFGFVPNDSAMQLKLLEKGMKKEDMALAILIDFPIQIFFGYYAARWSQGRSPMKPWRIAFVLRLLIAVVGMFTVYFFPAGGIAKPGDPSSSGSISNLYFYLILLVKVAGSMSGTVMFVGLSAFITRISDPLIGGTYMTLLNTLSNFGGTWPVYFVLESVDLFTKSHCSVPNESGKLFACATNEQSKLFCHDLGGTCIVQSDGFYTISIICITLSLLNFIFYIKDTVIRLERLPLKAWRIQGAVYQ